MMRKFLRRVQIAGANKGEILRFVVATKVAKLLVPKYRFKHPQMDWWDDEDFNSYLVRFDEKNGFNTDRRWIIHQLMRLVSSIPGDTAECGVFLGAGSYIILQANMQNDVHSRTHLMFDSFAGLSQPKDADGDYWQSGDLAVGEDAVDRQLADCQGYKLLKGWIPERFKDVTDRKFSFVHIDVDLYQPTLDSIAFFYDRMSDGGIILVDDYGFTTCPGATRAVEETLAGKPEQMIALPDGGGFMIKGTKTAAAARLSS